MTTDLSVLSPDADISEAPPSGIAGLKARLLIEPVCPSKVDTQCQLLAFDSVGCASLCVYV